MENVTNNNLAENLELKAKNIADKQKAKKEKKEGAKKEVPQKEIKSDLQSLLAQINKHNISAKGQGGNSREKIYRFQLNNSIDTISQKKLRNKLRNLTVSYCLNVKAVYLQNGEKINPAVKEIANKFVEFYKEQFILNDFSINSICSANRNEGDKKLMQSALDIVKKCVSK